MERADLPGAGAVSESEAEVWRNSLNRKGVCGMAVVFSCLPLSSFSAIAKELHSMLEKELEVKVNMADKLALLDAGQVMEHQQKQEGESGARGTQTVSRETLQVLLTAWLLEVKIEKHRVAEIWTAMEEEMSAGASFA
eukprot:TRINITY_DN11383_c0_g1_i1.p1 TRINITY_DN11383_c0_g1~~TRINITY_DN11383_c0_g1_i1.p1  ORF type:complete len:150 (+),score=53.92 TRINITY_DN11383_c0_g1_i1:37-450(+)